MSGGGAAREYPARPIVGIGIAVLRPDAVLLVRRGRAPAHGQWSLPGGAQRVGETAEEAARRELAEETGLRVGPLRLAGYADSIHRDAEGRSRFHYTILDFCGAYETGQARAGGDVTAVAWFAYDRLDELGLWPEMLRIIERAQALVFPAPPIAEDGRVGDAG